MRGMSAVEMLNALLNLPEDEQRLIFNFFIELKAAQDEEIPLLVKRYNVYRRRILKKNDKDKDDSSKFLN